MMSGNITSPLTGEATAACTVSAEEEIKKPQLPRVDNADCQTPPSNSNDSASQVDPVKAISVTQEEI